MSPRFAEVYAQCQMEIAAQAVAVTEERSGGGKYPDGNYQARHLRTEVVPWTQNGATFPRLILGLDITASPTQPDLIDKPLRSSYRIGPTMEDRDNPGQFLNPDGRTVESIYRKLFNEDPPLLMNGDNTPKVHPQTGTPLTDFVAVCERIAAEGESAEWNIALVTKAGKTFQNVYLNSIVAS